MRFIISSQLPRTFKAFFFGFLLIFSMGASAADKILILNIFGGFDQPPPNLASDLTASGYDVTTITDTYPGPTTYSLHTTAVDPTNGYDQVWLFYNTTNNAADMKQEFLDYLNEGGKIYLQTEVDCCDAAASFAQDFIESAVNPSLLTNFSHSEIAKDPGFALLNTSLVGPYGGDGLCRTVQTSAYRITRGLPRQNQIVVASNDPTAIVAAYFSESDMVGGKGRIVLLGDINFYAGGFGTTPIPTDSLPLPPMFANLLSGQQVGSICPKAGDDNFTINGTETDKSTPSVLTNDQETSPIPASAASAATLANVILTQLDTDNPDVTLDAGTGKITVPAGTGDGVYHVTYQICQSSVPTACVVAVATITVKAIATAAPVAAAAIPALGPWALLLLSMALAGFAAAGPRRTR